MNHASDFGYSIEGMLPSTTNRPTASDIRKSYEERGCEVRIDRDGHIKFRPADSLDRTWLEGRWVSEYRFEDGRITCIS